MTSLARNLDYFIKQVRELSADRFYDGVGNSFPLSVAGRVRREEEIILALKFAFEEHICSCGVRVVPHKCDTGKGF